MRLCKHFFQHIQHPVFLIGRADVFCRFFYILRGVCHRIAVAAVLEHLDVVPAVPECGTLLRRNPPALCEPLKPRRLVAAGNDQIDGTVGANFKMRSFTCLKSSTHFNLW